MHLVLSTGFEFIYCPIRFIHIWDTRNNASFITSHSRSRLSKSELREERFRSLQIFLSTLNNEPGNPQAVLHLHNAKMNFLRTIIPTSVNTAIDPTYTMIGPVNMTIGPANNCSVSITQAEKSFPREFFSLWELREHIFCFVGSLKCCSKPSYFTYCDDKVPALLVALR